MSLSQCHICGGKDFQPWCPGLLECRNCTHIQADMELSESELAELYGHKYFHGSEYVDYAQEIKALARNFTLRLNELKEHVPPPARLFEIGCAYGYFLEEAASVYEAAGCDISTHAIEIARGKGLDAVAADYLALPPPSAPFNIVCMWDTIEHISKPRSYVEKVFEELDNGGCFTLSTLDASSRVARSRREKWRMVHPPTHLHYFTVDSMKTMLHNAGFTDVEIVHRPFYRNVGSSLEKVAALSNNPLVKAGTRVAGSIPGINHLNFGLNLYDIMTATAWKK